MSLCTPRLTPSGGSLFDTARHSLPAMKTLFVHQNFPGQYLHLAPALAKRGHEVRALCMRQPVPVLQGVKVESYKVQRAPVPQQLPLLQNTQSKVLRAEAAAAACARMAEAGYTPDVICVHPGWGEALYLRELWPQARQLHFVEFYYAAVGQDSGFDPEFLKPDLAHRSRLVMNNLTLLHALHSMDAGVSPTQWQASTVPALLRDRISVIHDGIDTQRACPQAGARFTAATQAGVNLNLGAQDEVLSFVNRNLEPSRGYHRFMRALPAILRQRPRAQVVVVGESGTSYGAQPASGSHQQQYLDEITPQLAPGDRQRIHFVGRIPHRALMALFQVTRAHVYLTYPFVLSWSMLEAMACGAVVIGSDTPPVREVLRDGDNGRLVGFFDEPGLVQAVCDALPHAPGSTPMAQAARQTILEKYDLALCLPRQVALVEATAALPQRPLAPAA
jgi:glycosyltransferase involved in cell wall biosynthesis